MKSITLFCSISVITLIGLSGVLPLQSSDKIDREKKEANSPMERSKEEWKKILSPEQYRILREAGTERPNGKVYL